jgi:DNA helicase INO80
LGCIQVCNHPELFERADVIAPFAFSCFGQSGPLAREGDFISLPYSTRNPIKFSVPVLFYQDGGLLDIPSENSGGLFPGGSLSRSLDIWSPDWIQRSLDRRSKFSKLSIFPVG